MKSFSLARPHAFLLVGLPGSGKTHFAIQFAKMFSSAYINANDYLDLAKDNESAQEICARIVEIIATTSQSIIYEGDGSTRADRTSFTNWARKHHYTPVLIWVQTDPKICLERKQKAADFSPMEHEQALRQFNPPLASENAIVISGRHTFNSQAKAILSRVAEARKPQVAHTPMTYRPIQPLKGRSISIS